MQSVMIRLAQAAILFSLVTGSPASLQAQGAPAAPGARYFDAGRTLLAEGQTVAGFQTLTVAVLLAPDDMARQAYLLSQLDQGGHNWDVALHESLHAVAPGYPPIMQRLAKLYEGKGRVADAEALYVKWAATRPDNPEPYARLGEHYFFAGRYAEAVKAFERHRALMGESDYALRRLSAAHEALGHHDLAARLMAKADMIAPPPGNGVRVAGFLEATR